MYHPHICVLIFIPSGVKSAGWKGSYLEFFGHVFKAVQDLVRWRQGRGQRDVGDDAIQAVHVGDQQTCALVVARCAHTEGVKGRHKRKQKRLQMSCGKIRQMQKTKISRCVYCVKLCESDIRCKLLEFLLNVFLFFFFCLLVVIAERKLNSMSLHGLSKISLTFACFYSWHRHNLSGPTTRVSIEHLSVR